MFFFKCFFPIGPGTFDTFDAGMGLNLGDDRRDARHSEPKKNTRARGVRGARVHHLDRRRHPASSWRSSRSGDAASQMTLRETLRPFARWSKRVC